MTTSPLDQIGAVLLSPDRRLIAQRTALSDNNPRPWTVLWREPDTSTDHLDSDALSDVQVAGWLPTAAHRTHAADLARLDGFARMLAAVAAGKTTVRRIVADHRRIPDFRHAVPANAADRLDPWLLVDLLRAEIARAYRAHARTSATIASLRHSLAKAHRGLAKQVRAGLTAEQLGDGTWSSTPNLADLRTMAQIGYPYLLRPAWLTWIVERLDAVASTPAQLWRVFGGNGRVRYEGPYETAARVALDAAPRPAYLWLREDDIWTTVATRSDPPADSPATGELVPTGQVTTCCSSHLPGPSRPSPVLGANVAACCDPNDCGPCCPDCPTCPTLVAERAGAR